MKIGSSFSFPASFSIVAAQAQNKLSQLFKWALEPFVGAVLKVSLYREAYLQGRVSKWVVLPFVKTIGNLWFRLQGLPSQFRSFDIERLKKTEKELLEIGHKEQIVVRGQRSIPFVHFKGESALNPTCILYLNGFGLPYQTAKSFIHKHRAAGFDFAVFEWGKSALIDSFIEDAEAAYQALIQKGYQPKQIKILSYCGTGYVAAHLKLKHHAEGVDAIFINPHTSLRDVVEKSNRIGILGLGSIVTHASDLDNEKAFYRLAKAKASTCLIIDPENAITPPNTVERLQASLKESGCVTISIKEKFNKQFDNRDVWDRYTEFLRRPIPN